MKLASSCSTLVFILLLTLLVGGFASVTIAQQPGQPTGAQPPKQSQTTSGTPSSDPGGLSTFFALLASLSVATQKLVDIAKAWFPSLAAPPAGTTADPAAEAKRQRWVQLVAGVCGALTAWASWPVIKALPLVKTMWQADWDTVTGHGPKVVAIMVIGLLASGTSGPWNDLSNWLKSLKTKS